MFSKLRNVLRLMKNGHEDYIDFYDAQDFEDETVTPDCQQNENEAETQCLQTEIICTERINNPSNEKECIKKHIKRNGEIIYSGSLYLGDDEIKIHCKSSLLTCDKYDFIARITYKDQDEIDNTSGDNFKNIKQNLLNKIVILKIFNDELASSRNNFLESFKQTVVLRHDKSLNHSSYAKDLLQLHLINNNAVCKNPNDISSLQRIKNNKHISEDIKQSAQQLCDVETVLRTRNGQFTFNSTFVTSELKDITSLIIQWCNEGISHHRAALLKKCSMEQHTSRSIQSCIDKMNDKQVLLINIKCLDFFSELTTVMDPKIFSDFLNDLVKSFFKKIEKIRDPLKSDILIHPIYFSLCKSYQEVVLELSGYSNSTPNDVLRSHTKTVWNNPLKLMFSESFSLPLHRSLDSQCKLILKLLKYFEPGNDISEKKFEYEFNLLTGFNKYYIDDSRLIWIYILDSAVISILNDDQLHFYRPLVEGFINFIEFAEGDYFEMFRVVCHNIGKFIAQTCIYTTQSKEIDRSLFENQIAFINEVLREDKIAFDDLRDLMDIYNEFWKSRESIIKKLPNKFTLGLFRLNMEEIQKHLLRIIDLSLKKKVSVRVLTSFFRSYLEFLDDINCVDFSWYVKSSYESKEVELVNENKKSYKIIDAEKFIAKHDGDIPRHYIIDTINTLLSNVNDLLLTVRWSDDDCLTACSELLSAMRKSLLYLKEQPDYVQYHVFLEESTQPFINALHNSTDYQDYMKRISIVGESFWYLRKQDEIDIEKALALYKELNNELNTELLRNCYNKYLDKFNKYIQNTIKDGYDQKICFILEDLKDKLKKLDVSNYKNWGVEFKRSIMPELLAGLASVWSIQASKDLASTGKCLKPHCIQILCILNLLSVDKNRGIDKHLAQVLTGQGKSLVLGLLSSLLALTGHRVRTVCYSEYLAKRDLEDFTEFFKTFNEFEIYEKITYGTFEEMADEILVSNINGVKISFRDLITAHVLNTNEIYKVKYRQNRIQAVNTVLLIDEVDVFFSDTFYGNCYSAGSKIQFEALATIQEKIWDLVNSNKNNIIDSEFIIKSIKDFISINARELNDQFLKLEDFINDPRKYCILFKKGTNLMVEKEFTNQLLFDKNIVKMVNDAMRVVRGNNSDCILSNFIIDENGFICRKTENGEFSANVMEGYLNIFNYFRLKKNYFDSKSFQNYGYMAIDSGKVSYARLPKRYPLILGVSGTLTSLYPHESRAIKEAYNINKMSLMPSFFGGSHLKFDPLHDFYCPMSEDDWLTTIYNKAESKISSGVSVLIFFKTDVEINKFREKYVTKFERLYILTENTKDDDKKKYIIDSGVAKTVTVCTRGMGRGVDFKTSVVVEANGGVHVIQTFFSLDAKEETQIKGRTARKDNKGSYDLIVCAQHLRADGFTNIILNNVLYQTLDETRNLKMKEKGNMLQKKLEECENDHNLTMDYFEKLLKQ